MRGLAQIPEDALESLLPAEALNKTMLFLDARTVNGSSLKKLSVLIAHHAPVMRVGLGTLLRADGRFKIVGETGEAPVARRLILELIPDLVILSLTLRHGDGISLLKDFRQLNPAARAVVMTTRRDVLSVQRAFKAGARGYLVADEEPADVLASLEQVAAGELYASGPIARGLLQMLACGAVKTRGNACEHLSDRELQVFRLIGSGFGTSRVASELHLSVKTIESHRQRIKQKLGLTSAAELTQRAAEWLLHSAHSRSLTHRDRRCVS